MVLVDTSVLIDFLKSIRNPAVDKFHEILELKIPYGITSHIYQELLQGTASEKDFTALKSYLDTMVIYSPMDLRDSYAEAARIFFQCRKKGIVIRSTIDCLIVQIARERRLKLLHRDRDYDQIGKVITDLLLF